MSIDIRSSAARFYDLSPEVPRDIPFYLERIPSSTVSVLELGCGTGRVTVPLAANCGFILGIDSSPAMLARCKEKLKREQVPPDTFSLHKGDITDFDYGRSFDLIIAPFRVMQNLATDEQVKGLLRSIRRHLAPGGTAILNAFRPNLGPGEMRTKWVTSEERLAWEVAVEGGRVTCHDRRLRMDKEPLVLYPDLVYRHFEGDRLAEEAVLHLAMRCWYPKEFERLITENGFEIVNRWGGYAGETYGEGPELVLQFTDKA